MLTHGHYLLDTCVCIALIKQVPSVVEQIRLVGVSDCKISDLTTLVTGNVKHFERIPGLRIENWIERDKQG